MSVLSPALSQDVGPAIKYANELRQLKSAQDISDGLDFVGVDDRPLASLYSKKISDRKFLWWGDSTTEQMAGIGFINYSGIYGASSISTALIGSEHYNYGANGRTLESVMQPGEDLNGGGHNVKINAIVDFATSNPGACYVICFGINDCRRDAGIAGSSYGDAAQVAKADDLRVLLKSARDQIKAADPTAQFVWRMPTSHGATSPGYLENGVTGQNAMDVYRLTYRGDATLGLSQIDEYVGDGLFFDTLRACYTDYAIQDFGLLHSDNLHPSQGGYEVLLSSILPLLALGSDDISSKKDASEAFYLQKGASQTILPPNTIVELEGNPEVYAISYCKILNAAATYLDVNFESQDVMWGGANGSGYGSANMPALSFGDIIAVTKSDGEELIMHITNQADSNNGSYLRWYNGGPSGFYPGAEWTGAAGNIYRHKYANSNKARLNDKRLNSIGAESIMANEWFLVNVKSTANGSCVIQGIAGQQDGFDSYTPAASDSLCLIGVDGNDELTKGVELTSATITAGGNPSEWNISLAGHDFRNAMCRQAVLIKGQ